MSFKGQINEYVCQTCKGVTVTIDAVYGVTPFMILCRKMDCGGMAQSSFYQVEQFQRPSFEWYMPDAEELANADAETREYCRRGCLLLRRVGLTTLATFNLDGRNVPIRHHAS